MTEAKGVLGLDFAAADGRETQPVKWQAEGRALRALREAAGLTQAELGERVGMSDAIVSQWETGIKKPRRKSAESVGRALGAADEVLALYGFASGEDGSVVIRLARLEAEADQSGARIEALERHVTRLTDLLGQLVSVEVAEEVAKPVRRRRPS